MIAWAVAAALAAQAQTGVVPAYVIKQSGGGLGIFVEETVVVGGVHGSKRRRGAPLFWVVEQRRADSHLGEVAPDGTVLKPFGWTRKHRWIDSRTCPGLAEMVQALSAMLVGDEARLAAAERFGIRQLPSLPTFDAPGVSITRLPGDVPNMSDIGGPLTRWWWLREMTLEPCWRDDAPLVNGRPVAPLIKSEGPR